MVKTALPCDLAIAQKITSKVLYPVGFHFKTLRHIVTSKPCQTKHTPRAALVMVGCCQHGLQLLSVMFRVTCANEIQRS